MTAGKEIEMTIKFEMEKATKNTIKFAEVLADELDTAKIGSLYVQKAALKAIGWGEGKQLEVELKVKE